ncbi:Cobalamin biosynthesis protein CobW [Nitratireductor aquibiodomus RA22]|uniref:Cobalamin biosynthesis protein CobW n=1 Tax=Nitratireductor aquibiodomus RA22 TaxID=1189611 RepID=I5BWX3_9HYPH|nr:CobW family GTP-binding protein [Nitratireductor aquibiodomus]EIM74075.1 Cobalamin biosynthesis protein CobW [Nitratireductor aquibiodomus RA22]
MSVPVLLVTGFLGAGKTTFINRLLQAEHGLRIAAIVNDFGSINIDAELLAQTSEGVIGLKNGCICCSLQGDLMRTLKVVLSRTPKPELIVIEASGVADPAGIVQSLMDPVIWKEARLETVIGIVDAPDAARRADDPLWQAQLQGSDILFLSKTTECPQGDLKALRAGLASRGKNCILNMDDAPVPLSALFIEDTSPRAPVEADLQNDDRFVHVEWEYEGLVDLPSFQEAILRISDTALRGKGLLSFTGRQGRHVFQLVGKRATLSSAPWDQEKGCRLILIGERNAFDADAVLRKLNKLRMHTSDE